MLELVLRVSGACHSMIHGAAGAGRCVGCAGCRSMCYGAMSILLCDFSAITRSEFRGLKALIHGASLRVGVVEGGAPGPLAFWLSAA